MPEPSHISRCLWLSKPMVPFWGRCTTHSTRFSGDWDVHWGYALGFDPQPDVCFLFASTSKAYRARSLPTHAAERSLGVFSRRDASSSGRLAVRKPLSLVSN